ncbi:MAG: tetratricopeptide repeat protein [Bacteroidota bacterium]
MRQIILSLIILCTQATLHAQVIKGKVHDGLTEMGLADVAIRVEDFSDQTTDRFGLFKVPVQGKQRGELLTLNLLKRGYSVINREATKPRIPDTDKEEIAIYMCLSKDRDSLAGIHYGIQVRRNIKVQYDTDVKALAEKMDYESIAKLTRERDKAENMADSLAARLARFDPALASSELTRAMQLYQQGNVEEALEVLDAEKIMTRIESRRILIEDLQEANQQDIDALLKAADMAITNLQLEKAQDYLIKAVEADTTQFNHLLGLCVFLHYQAQSKLLLVYANRLVRLADKKVELATGLLYLGLALLDQKSVPKALPVFEKSLQLYKELASENPQLYQGRVSASFRNLGLAYMKLERFQKALGYLQKSLSIEQKLAEQKPPQNLSELTLTTYQIGLAYQELGLVEEAQDHLLKAVEMSTKLAQEEGQQYGASISAVFSQLGSLINGSGGINKDMDPGQMLTAVKIIEDYLALARKLADDNPQRNTPTLATILNTLGSVYFSVDDESKALASYQEALSISRKLHQENPERYQLFLAEVITNLGNTYYYLKSYPKAVTNFTEAGDLLEEISRKTNDSHTQLSSVLLDLCLAYIKLDMLQEAEETGLKATAQFQELNEQASVHLYPKLSFVQYNLAMLYLDQNEYRKSLPYLLKAIKIDTYLTNEDPEKFGLSLFLTYYELGETYASLIKLPEAIHSFQLVDSVYQSYGQGDEELVQLARQKIQQLSRIDAQGKALDNRGWQFFQNKQADSALTYLLKAQEAFEQIPSESIDIQVHENFFLVYSHLSILETDPEKNYPLLKKAIYHCKIVADHFPENPTAILNLANAYNNLSWYALFVQSFSEAEEAAQKALTLSPESTGVISNLASSLLFQGKWEEAKSLYESWKDKAWVDERYSAFKEVFLADLGELEAAGITHPDIEKVRKLLVE